MFFRHSLQELMRRAFLLSIAVIHCVVARPQGPPVKSGDEIPDLKAFLPEEATLTKQMAVDFTNGREPASIVIAYQMRDEEGLRILQRGKADEWKVAYEENDPGEPVQNELILYKVKAANRREGLVVVLSHSGAGTTTDWKIIAQVRGKFQSQDAAPIRDKVLNQRHLIFAGYNKVAVRDDLIIETIPGHSQGAAVCCPDERPVDMRVKFTGSSIKLDSVGRPANQAVQKIN